MNLTELSGLADSNTKVPEVFSDYRKKQLNLFKENGFTTDPEFYKFTNIPSFFESSFKETKKTSVKVETAKYLDSFLPTVLFLNGELQSTPDFQDLIFKTLDQDENKVKEQLKEGTPLSHLHHGLLGSGLTIELPRGKSFKSPLRILHLITQENVIAPTLILKLGENTEFTLVEETRGLVSSYAYVAESYVTLAEGSCLEHIQLDGGEKTSLHHGSTWAQVGKDASYKNFTFLLSGKMNRRNLSMELKEPGSNGESYELFLTCEDEHADVNSVIHHLAPDTTSNQIAKGILGGESKGVFTGKIHIHPKAQRVVSGQLNKNLLLSKKAHVHSQPQLEIFADDVKCSHGSTTGQMSEEEIFYFQTRGIPAEKARTLLAFGFGLDVVLKIKNQKIRERIEIAVMSALREKYKLGIEP